MKDIYFYIITGVIVAILIVFIVISIVKYAKMKPEERREFLKTYVKGLVALAEQTIVGSKKGQEKLKMVEDYFNKKAPFAYKFVLSLIGKENLEQIIEEALEDIKKSFGA